MAQLHQVGVRASTWSAGEVNTNIRTDLSIQGLATKMTLPRNSTPSAPTLKEATVAVIMALPNEWVSARKIFVEYDSDLHNQPGQIFSYDVCRVPSNDGGHNVVALVLLPDFGTTQAAAYTAHLLGQCEDIKEVVVCGIGGAISDPSDGRDIRLGDIVYMGPTGVVQHDNFKDFVEKTGAKPKYDRELRMRARTPSSRMANIARELDGLQSDGQYPWVERLNQLPRPVQRKFGRPKGAKDILYACPRMPGDTPVPIERSPRAREVDRPHAFPGGIASGNRLLKNPEYRNELRGTRFHVLDLKCVEMEGAGVAEATHLYQKGCFIVRGISDYCDDHKNDDWHNYATGNAAAYVYCLLVRLPDLRRVKAPPQPVGAGPEQAISSVAASEPPVDTRVSSTVTSQLMQEAAPEPAGPAAPVPIPLPAGAAAQVPSVSASPVSYTGFMEALKENYQQHEWEAYYKYAQDFETWISANRQALSKDELVKGRHAIAIAYMRLVDAGFDKKALLARVDVIRQKIKELTNG